MGNGAVVHSLLEEAPGLDSKSFYAGRHYPVLRARIIEGGDMNKDLIQQFNGQGSSMTAMHKSDPAAIAAAEAVKARIQSAYIMALQKPRNVDDARARILRSCKRPAFAERVEFAKPVGKTKVRGPSIRFAELALREWENVLTETQVVYEDDEVRRIKVLVTDLESNSTHSKEIVINKTVERKNPEGREVLYERINSTGEKVYVVRATEDEIHNKEAAMVSKAIRNEGLRLIPSDIIDEAIETARATLRNRDAKDPDAAKKAVIDAFSELNIRPLDLEDYLGHKLELISPGELEELRGIYRAIRDGETRWIDVLEARKKPEKEETKQDRPPQENEPELGEQPFDPYEGVKKTFKEDIEGRLEEGERDLLEAFLDATSQAHNITVNAVKHEALENAEEFLKCYREWREKKKKQREEPEKHWVSEWINLRKGTPPNTGFYAYVKEHLEEFRRAPKEVRTKAIGKWYSLYPTEPCPFDTPEGILTTHIRAYGLKGVTIGDVHEFLDYVRSKVKDEAELEKEAGDSPGVFIDAFEKWLSEKNKLQQEPDKGSELIGDGWMVKNDRLYLSCPDDGADVTVQVCHDGCQKLSGCKPYQDAIAALEKHPDLMQKVLGTNA